jgi:putative membrane protein insertion efficiency factor
MIRRMRIAGAGLLCSFVAAIISLYKYVVSPVVVANAGPACRFEPTCSEYARDAIVRHGLVRGALMGIRRLARCRPGGGWGYDPVPDRLRGNR